MSAQKWVRSSLRTLSVKLEAAGHVISPPTVGRLLRTLDYSLHVNAKKTEASSAHPDREQQFDYIAVQRATFTLAGLPIISADTKKKELVGDFKNAGQTWSLEPTAVNVHDYPHDALGRAVPYGVYDVTTNRGFIYLGTSGDTPAFAVDAIAAWWQTDGRAAYPPGTEQLLVLADAGGSNGCRVRAWKERLQVEICDRFGIAVTVCHYPLDARNGTRSSIVCLARSAVTGLVCPSEPGRRCWLSSVAQRPRLGWSSRPSLSRGITRKGSRSVTTTCTP